LVQDKTKETEKLIDKEKQLHNEICADFKKLVQKSTMILIKYRN